MSERAEPRAAALIRVLWVPARREPDHRTEMVTQWLCGERVETLEEREGWIRGRGQDGYSGWLPKAAITPDPGGDWPGSAAWSLGAHMAWSNGRRSYLPWGARVRRQGDDLWLPDGTRAHLVDRDAVVSVDELRRRYPRDACSIVSTARSWMGVPYVWGGRTDTGCDCSGFVQAVFAAHGISLPRDSREQADSGERRSLPDLPAAGLDSADLVFFAPENAGITHVAIATGGTGILHCSSTRGIVSEDDLSADGGLERILRESAVCATRPIPSETAG